MFEDVIDDIKNAFASKKYIRAIILFGSVARGEATQRSDIDLCIIVSSGRSRVEKFVSATILHIEKKHNMNIQYVFTDAGFTRMNKQFLDTILREGRVIHGKLPEIPIQKLDLEPYSLIKYNLVHLPQSEKMKISRMLFGKETQKVYKGKVYVSKKKGFLMECGGIRTGIASLLIPSKYARKIVNELRGYGAQVRVIPAWLQKV